MYIFLCYGSSAQVQDPPDCTNNWARYSLASGSIFLTSWCQHANTRHSSKSHKKKCCKKEITCIIRITNQSLEFVTGKYEINNTLQWTWDKTADCQCRRGNSRWFLVDIFDNDLWIIIKDTWIKHLNILLIIIRCIKQKFISWYGILDFCCNREWVLGFEN